MFLKCWLFHPQYSPRSSRRHIAHQALTVHSSSLLAIHPCPQNNPLLASEWDTCGRQYNTALKWKKYLFVCNHRHHASLSECVWFQIRLVPLSYLTICVFWCADVESIWNVSRLSGPLSTLQTDQPPYRMPPQSRGQQHVIVYVELREGFGLLPNVHLTSECLKS